jgi:photosystem II stability/assembly factor-like uncharacterized protein
MDILRAMHFVILPPSNLSFNGLPGEKPATIFSGQTPTLIFMGKLFQFGLCTVWAMLFFGLSCKKDPLALPVFRELTVPVRDDLTSVWFADSLHGVATGGAVWESGFVLSTSNGGETWQVDTMVNKRLECVMFDAAGQGYVCGQDGLVLHRPPGLPWWYTLRVDFCWNRGCYFWDDRQGVVVAGEGFQGGLARKLGPEALWIMDTLVPFPNALSAVWFSDSVTVHAVGLGYVLRSDDGGLNWFRHNVTGDFFQSIHFPTPTTGYICSAGGTILKTTDAGRSWQIIREGGSLGKNNRPFRAVWFVSAEKGYLVGDNGLFWRTENGGSDWTVVAGLPGQVNATDVFVLNGRGWITGTEGRLFYFED